MTKLLDGTVALVTGASSVMSPLQETPSPSCLISIILSMRFIFSLGLMISGRTRFLTINEHTNEICYTLTWSKNKIKFELVETNPDRVVDTS
jgi:hypothetical protein